MNTVVFFVGADQHVVGLTLSHRRASLQRRGLKHCTKRSKKGEQRGEIYDATAARGIGAKLGPLPEVHTLAIFADGIEEHYGTLFVIKRDLSLAGGEPQPMFLFGK